MNKGSPLKADPFLLEAASGFEPLNRGLADLINKFSECFLTSFHSHLIDKIIKKGETPVIDRGYQSHASTLPSSDSEFT
jgi:ribosome maturation protein Sdo1